MTDQPNAPQLYLITPVGAAASTLGPLLADVMDRFPVACLRIPGAGTEEELGRLADLAREIAHARDVAVVIDNHLILAERLGLDGVHLTDGSRNVRKARKDLGADAIVVWQSTGALPPTTDRLEGDESRARRGGDWGVRRRNRPR